MGDMPIIRPGFLYVRFFNIAKNVKQIKHKYLHITRRCYNIKHKERAFKNQIKEKKI